MNPCKDLCFARFGKEYTQECDKHCDYARLHIELKQLRANLDRVKIDTSPPYIDADDVIEQAMYKLDKIIPSADVVPVRHGKWIRLQHSGTIVCGNCGRNIRKNHGNDYADFELYCPSCGSRMDIKEENNLGTAL